MPLHPATHYMSSNFAFRNLDLEEVTQATPIDSRHAFPRLDRRHHQHCDFNDTLSKLSELYDHPALEAASGGIRLNTVVAHQPHVSYFDLTYRTSICPQSLYDICVYHTQDSTVNMQESRQSPIMKESILGSAGGYGVGSHVTYESEQLRRDSQLSLIQREAPLRRLMKLTRTELRESPEFEKRLTDVSTSPSNHYEFSPNHHYPPIWTGRDDYDSSFQPQPSPSYYIANSTFASSTSTPHAETSYRDAEDVPFHNDWMTSSPFSDTDTIAKKSPCVLMRLKQLVIKALRKSREELEEATYDAEFSSNLSMTSWASSDGTLSGWTMVSVTSQSSIVKGGGCS